MEPEVEAAVVRVAGDWAMKIVERNGISKKDTPQYLNDTFRWAYETLSQIATGK